MAEQLTVTALKNLLKNNENWKPLLLSSLVDGCKSAKEQLNEEGRKHFEPYPDNLEKYYAFLNNMVMWIPTQDYASEVLFHLCKFYWLLDQPSGRELQCPSVCLSISPAS